MTAVRIGLVWRGDAGDAAPAAGETRFRQVFEAFSDAGAEAEPVLFAEEVADDFRERLLRMDGVLVWVDPIVRGRDRTTLDAILRDVAARGVFVSAHPEVIMKMGTKEVLHRTREMAWGTDARVYRTTAELRDGLLETLRGSGTRVVKQDRGSSGNGVWRVELVGDASSDAGAIVRVQPAQRQARVEEMALLQFVSDREAYFKAFGGTGCFVDQPYADRLEEGMVRAYLVHDRVAGFGHQYVTALTPAPPGESAPDPPPRLYFGPDKPEFQQLRTLLESGWIAEMCRALDVEHASLPVIWDADFLLGPKDEDGADAHLLCEINISGVFPIPDESIAPLVAATVERARAARQRRPAG
jgi:hypothetical protein